MLKGTHITVKYGALTAVDDLSFELREGQWLMLAGPNGAGKSTLIEAIAQGVPSRGALEWEGQDLRRMKASLLARRIGVLSQKNRVEYSYTVEEVVRLGRYAYRAGLLGGKDREEEKRVEEALEMTGMTALRQASMLTLSGGETQRAFLAQVFAQNPRVLILDEPANHLDLKYQQRLFSLIEDWRREPGRAVLSVVHDLSLARKYGTHALLMNRGRCAAQGEAAETLSPDNLRRVYEMDVQAWMRGLLAQWE